MSNMKKYIRIFVALSIVFMQSGNIYASIFLPKKDGYIQICTSNGIKFIKLGRFKDSDISYNEFNLMNCCLDIHKNFILDSYTSIQFSNFITFYGNSNIESEKILFYVSSKSIRAPPYFS